MRRSPLVVDKNGRKEAPADRGRAWNRTDDSLANFSCQKHGIRDTGWGKSGCLHETSRLTSSAQQLEVKAFFLVHSACCGQVEIKRQACEGLFDALCSAVTEIERQQRCMSSRAKELDL